MNKMYLQNGACNQQGVALIEVLIAIVIFSIGILGIIGLQAGMVKASGEAKYRAEASFVAQQRIAKIWATPDSMDNFAEADEGTDISTETGLPSGRRFTTRDSTNLKKFTVKVTWKQPGTDETHSVSVIAYITPNNKLSDS